MQRALRSGIYQGWDLHPAQLPTRFAASFAFFRAGFAEAAVRLGDYHRQRSGSGVLDEPATAFALARHLAAAVHCGAVTAAELHDAGGIGPAVVDRYLVRNAVPGVEVADERPARPNDPRRGGASVNLTPADTEKLLLSVAGMVARDRLARGVVLNYPETVALLTTWVIERAREGRSVADLMEEGRAVLRRDQVMEGVAEMIPDVQIEATFPDGRKLVTIHSPIK